VFFGLVLCATHLSDITARIAGNMLSSAVAFKSRIAELIFPGMTLNTDTMVRLMTMHYLFAGLLLTAGLFHGIDMHYDWKQDTEYTGLKECVNWVDEGLCKELANFLIALWIIVFVCRSTYHEQEPLSYELFAWGDLGLVVDINFYAVAPHWYFRPYMA
jgi:quinol-cytochrome oxidoreductase complex cytochrome b subunit